MNFLLDTLDLIFGLKVCGLLVEFGFLHILQDVFSIFPLLVEQHHFHGHLSLELVDFGLKDFLQLLVCGRHVQFGLLPNNVHLLFDLGFDGFYRTLPLSVLTILLLRLPEKDHRVEFLSIFAEESLDQKVVVIKIVDVAILILVLVAHDIFIAI